MMAPCAGGPVHLRPAEERDAAAMAAIQVRAMRRALVGVVPEDSLKNLSESERERAWRREIAVLPSILRPTVAEVDDRVLGFLGALPSVDATSGVSDAEVTVYVDPDCWKHGVGRMLVDHEVRILRHLGREAIATWVVEDDRRARAFAKAMGWHEDGGRRDRNLGTIRCREVRCRAVLV